MPRFGLWLLSLVVGCLVVPAVLLAGEENEPFSVVLLPDTQFYSEKFPENYMQQAVWIRQNVEKENIKFSIHLGDIVQTASKENEWKNADKAMRVIDGVLPYSMVPGNHDQEKEGGKLKRITTLYNKYFGPQRFESESWYGGNFEGNNDNNYCTFEAAGMKFMVISLEFCARDEVLAWAGEVAAKHPDHRIIVATHCYMGNEGRKKNGLYGLVGNSGEDVWHKLIKKQPNIFFVVSGHVLGTGMQTSVNQAGGNVHEMLVDYQGLKNGGNGWLRILKFDPASNKITVKSYSPVLDETNNAADEAFSLEYEMRAAAVQK